MERDELFKGKAENEKEEAGIAKPGGEEGIGRRKLLKGLGMGSMLLAGSAIAPSLALAEEAAGNDKAMRMNGVLQVPHVQALLNLPPGLLQPGVLVWVGGYYSDGDGGGKLVRWNAGSTKPDNGGTVHDPHGGSGKPGRWEQVHNGVADFRSFGIMGPDQNADDALEAMVNDASIHRIEAHTDLNFARRHTFYRSGIELDFHGHTVTTNGIELNTLDNPFGAVLFFRGVEDGSTQTVTLSSALPELTDVLEVQNAAAFQVDDWWIAQVSNQPGGGSQRELDYMLKVTEIVDSTHIRVNYKLGWEIAAGRTITYKKMKPVFRCCVRNMRFIGVPVPPTSSTTVRPFDTWDQIGSHPVAYEFAVECDVSGIRATKTFWPVIMRRYCSHYVTENCELVNPEERDWGGTGYLTQQINVLYGHVRNCNASNARHLNDFTHAAYCLVENCHGDGDDYGPFVTHGQFEHDLVYIGNSGMLSFANSGTFWGDSAKRITVKKHVATRIIAHKKLTDLTLEDVHAFKKEGLANSGSIWANADGLQMRGCTAETMLTLSRSSARSKRKNIADGCTFGMTKDYEIARPVRSSAVGNLPVDADFVMQNCEFLNVDNNNIGSINQLVLINTWFRGASPTAAPIRVGSKEIVISGGGFEHTGMLLTGAYDQAASGVSAQTVTVDGSAFIGTNAEKAFFKSAAAGNDVTWSFNNIVSTAADADTAHFHIGGGTNRFFAAGSRFRGGRYEAAGGGFGNERYFLLNGCIEEGVNRASLPAENGSTIKHSEGNIVIGS